MMSKTLAWSCGGGRQSVGIAALIVQGKLPKPDIAIIVDTEREKSSTWNYYGEILRPELARVGVDLVRVKKSDYATVDLYRNDDLLIPAFTTQNGKVSKMSTFCSNEWKQRVVRRYLRAQGVTDCDCWLGISINEADRMKDSGLKWLRHVYPLIDLSMNVWDCVCETAKVGWPAAMSSACWMCPNQNQAEWLALSERDFRSAQAFEFQIQKTDPFVHLTRTGATLTRESVANAVSNTLDHCGPHCMV